MTKCTCGNTKAIRAHCCRECKAQANKRDKRTAQRIRAFGASRTGVEYHGDLMLGYK
jgi:hypothetical protein